MSSPEGSDGSSPSSSDGTGANPALATTNNLKQSAHSHAAPADKRKVEPKTTAALKDRRASNGAEPIDGIHTHPDAFDDDDGAASTLFLEWA